MPPDWDAIQNTAISFCIRPALWIAPGHISSPSVSAAPRENIKNDVLASRCLLADSRFNQEPVANAFTLYRASLGKLSVNAPITGTVNNAATNTTYNKTPPPSPYGLRKRCPVNCTPICKKQGYKVHRKSKLRRCRPPHPLPEQ